MQPVLEELALYIHIPFCTSRCHYCNFYFETGWSPRVMKQTLAQTLAETGAMLELLGNPPVTTMYFGGGTPSVIPATQLDEFLGALGGILAKGGRNLREIDFEANPESITSQRLEVLSRHAHDLGGRLRISLGVQSFDASVLRSLGRRSNPADIHKAISLLNSRTDIRKNLDIIYGAPGQSLSDFESDAALAAAAGFDGISLYELTIEEGTALHQSVTQGKAVRPDSLVLEHMWESALVSFESAGYRNYEVSNFALPGREALHNFAYWNLRPCLGVGPGAVSLVPIATGNALVPISTGNTAEGNTADGSPAHRPTRITNPGIFEYGRIDFAATHPANLNSGDAGASNAGENLFRGRGFEQLGSAEIFCELFLTGLRTVEGVSLRAISHILGAAGQQLALRLARRWRSYLLTTHNNFDDITHIVLQDRYRYTLNSFLEEVADISTELVGHECNWPAFC